MTKIIELDKKKHDYYTTITFYTKITFYKLLCYIFILPNVMYYWGVIYYFQYQSQDVLKIIYVILLSILTTVGTGLNFLRIFYNPYNEHPSFHGYQPGLFPDKNIDEAGYKNIKNIPYFNNQRILSNKPCDKIIRKIFVFFGLETYDGNKEFPPTISDYNFAH